VSTLGSTIHELRTQGLSYNSITKVLNCSKSTVSYYCSPNEKHRLVTTHRKWRKEHILANKIFAFRYRKSCPKSPPRTKSKSGRRRDLYFKVVNFQRRFGNKLIDCRGAYMRNFTEQDVKEKFNERNCCYLSGLPIELENGSTYELDHILPTKRDGENTLENLEFINPDVNSMKGKRTNEEFLRLVFLIADYCKDQKPKVIL
jgi:hypothetical protein